MGPIEERLAGIETTLKQQDDAIFGAWDPKMRVRTPGILERLDLLTKIIFWGLSPITALYTLSALGVPLQDTVPAIVKILVTSISH